MPGGDLATRFPERMLYGILPDDRILALLAGRGWSDIELGVMRKQVASGFNVTRTSSTGRVLDAAAALLGICREKTYDGEPAMKLEAAAYGGHAEKWELVYGSDTGCAILSTRSLMETALAHIQKAPKGDLRAVRDIASSFQYNLSRGIAALAIQAAEHDGMQNIAISGGVAINHAIRETIKNEITKAGYDCVINAGYPLGDGCVSYGQCVYAGKVTGKRK
jgi:hydrogenase maturation protein HypF